MSMIFFTFRAQTKARRGAMLLREKGIPAQLGKTPGRLAVNGCGYGIWVQEVRGKQAAEGLRAGNAAYEKSYRMDGGNFTEVRL